jgi:hypothetical protein
MKVVMKFINSILALTMLSFVNVGVSQTCTCIGPADAKEGLELSEAVFSGRVFKSDEFKAEVEVERVWKGKFTKARVIVFNPAPKEECSLVLRRGQRYIVFASEDREKGRVSYIPKICFPTSVLSKAEQTLKEIGEGEQLKQRRRMVRR